MDLEGRAILPRRSRIATAALQGAERTRPSPDAFRDRGAPNATPTPAPACVIKRSSRTTSS
jgi:hypothetical protein